MSRECPVCHETMTCEQRGSVTIDRSPTCGTLWLDRTELAAIVDAEAPGATVSWGRRRPDEGTVGPCPTDGAARLDRYDLDGLPFHRCPACRGIAMAAEVLERLLLRSAGVPGGEPPGGA